MGLTVAASHLDLGYVRLNLRLFRACSLLRLPAVEARFRYEPSTKKKVPMRTRILIMTEGN